MGRIKNMLVKRTARGLIKEDYPFAEGFDNNKNILGSTMPSKRLRNQIAGYITRMKRNDQKKRELMKTQVIE